MGVRVGMLVLFVLSMTWVCDARNLVVSGLSEKVGRNEKMCTLCEEYATQALDYLAQNKTQTEIIEALHLRCGQMRNFKQQCMALVDYYAPLFFKQVETMQPEDFCRKVDLCEKVAALASEVSQNSCDMCHQTVSEMLVKLKDPDTQLDVIQLLMKGCKSMKQYEKKCKKMVLEYGPVLLVNAENFLETKDVCTMMHACPAKASLEMGGDAALADS